MTQYIDKTEQLYPHEIEQASNSYLMAVVAVIAGVPLPIVNVIASFLFYLGQRKSSYFVRWHCIQAILAQAIMVPFNSIAIGWTIRLLIDENTPDMYYIMYISFVLVFNIVEFFTVIITAAEVRKGKNVRWFLIANLTDAITSKENRDPYKI
ncbi:DUF4870 domain-containing protein [Flavobacterium sp. Sd200]|uniref:DUF4870 domain-containing protein n=1 Tax=Flavobacterium sp. Sd200 TaxID=2692211 RepID=UPI00136D956C|nr:DUF4870 domain-containing protein [Flavobacterium sp. Sd200]MXN92449.1 DUF4870 domain-containing protein [Flavobacterium sp. Sd200]